MDTITFKLDPAIAKKLRNESAKNRRFNNHSEICRTLVMLYLTDDTVKRVVNEAMRRKYINLVESDSI